MPKGISHQTENEKDNVYTYRRKQHYQEQQQQQQYKSRKRRRCGKVNLIKRKMKKKTCIRTEASSTTKSSNSSSSSSSRKAEREDAESTIEHVRRLYSSRRIFCLIFENEKTVQPESTRATRKTYLTHPYIFPVSYTHLTLPTIYSV